MSLIEAKKELFRNAVKQVSKDLDFEKPPQVVFYDGYIPSQSSNTIACINPSTYVIYVSLTHIINMNHEEIREVAVHELSHMFEQSHDASFVNKNLNIRTGTWKPSSTSGLHMCDGREKKVKLKGSGIDEATAKTICHYHLCRKKTELIKCPYCGKKFCKEHITPMPPSMPKFDYPNKFNEWKNEENCHPCPSYYDCLVKKEQERIEKCWQALGKLSHYSGVPDENYEITDSIKPKFEIQKNGKTMGSCSYCFPRGDREDKTLYQCNYCKEWFCRKHKPPRRPMSAPFKSTDIKVTEEWKKDSGHPCVPYVDYIKDGKSVDLDVETSNEEETTHEPEPIVVSSSSERDWVDDIQGEEKDVEHFKKDDVEKKGKIKKSKRKKRSNLFSNFRRKISNFRYRLHRRHTRGVNANIGIFLSLFIPLFVGLLVLYLLTPGMVTASQFLDTETIIDLILAALLLPAEAQSFVPWIGWIASGIVGGILSRRVLIPFVSMYILIWIGIYIIEGELFLQQLSMFGVVGFEQIIIQTFIVNFIFAILAFGFGGWIGTSIRSR